MTTEVSHGRGGAGNINTDDTQYADGEVVRSGLEGSHGDGAYSSGRGGLGNIADVGTSAAQRADQDVIPDAAVRPSQDNKEILIGRGGAGNHLGADHEKKAATQPRPEAPVGLADKLKGKLFGAFKR